MNEFKDAESLGAGFPAGGDLCLQFLLDDLADALELGLLLWRKIVESVRQGLQIFGARVSTYRNLSESLPE